MGARYHTSNRRRGGCLAKVVDLPKINSVDWKFEKKNRVCGFVAPLQKEGLEKELILLPPSSIPLSTTNNKKCRIKGGFWKQVMVR